jgi:uncharacterized protein (TIGR02246 family)
MRTSKVVTAAVALLAAVVVGVLWSQEPKDQPAKVPGSAIDPARQPDADAIRKTAVDYAAAFEKGDAKAVAAFWTPEGEFIDENGEVMHGRPAIEKALAEMFAKNKGCKLETTIGSIRFVGRDSAVEEGVLKLKHPDGRPTTSTRYSVLHNREDGKWLMAIVREWASDDADATLKDVEWLIGNWVAKDKDAEARSSYEWAENKAFMRCRFSVRREGKEVASGTQIIGRDPTTGGLRSWVFDTEGGFGEGTWTQDGTGWVIDSNGTLADGSSVSATNILRKVNADSFTWQSVGREQDGEAKPDVAPLKVVRVKAGE